MPDQATGLIDWSRPQQCLLLGAAGSGMSVLAQILNHAGHHVYGADTAYGGGNTSSESSAGTLSSASTDSFIRRVGWDDSDPGQPIDVCITSPAVSGSAPLYQWACDHAVPLLTLPAAVGDVFSGRARICVAGTHGKSTTSGLLAWMLNHNQRDAGVFVGANLGQWNPAGPREATAWRGGTGRSGGH